MNEQFAQGDLLFVRVSDKASKIKSQPGKKAIFARGEKTGHVHEIQLDDVQVWPTADGPMKIVVAEPTPVVHNEHAPLMLPEGEYVMYQQRQYVPEKAPASMAFFE